LTSGSRLSPEIELNVLEAALIRSVYVVERTVIDRERLSLLVVNLDYGHDFRLHPGLLGLKKLIPADAPDVCPDGSIGIRRNNIPDGVERGRLCPER